MSQEIKSWNNGIVEDQAGSTLPDVHTEDNGKVLQVVEGQWQKGGVLPSPELPTPSSDNSGKIAKVVEDGEGGYIWGAENETSELPAVESTDINKLVGVVSDGASGAEYGLVSAPASPIVDFTITFSGAGGQGVVEEGAIARVMAGVTNNSIIRAKISGLKTSSGADVGDFFTIAKNAYLSSGTVVVDFCDIIANGTNGTDRFTCQISGNEYYSVCNGLVKVIKTDN